MQTVEDFVQVGDDRIHYIHGGTPRSAGAAPVVFVHGISGGTDWWAKNLPAVAQHDEFYALDLPGFGRTQTSRTQFNINDEIGALSGWLAAVNVGRAVFVGHSLGGYVTAALSARSPGLTRGLVLVDPAIFPPDYSPARLALALFREPLHLSLGFVPTLLGGAAAAGLSTILAAARELLAHPILQELSAIQAPMLLIWGDNDALVPATLSAGIIAATAGRAAGPVLLRGGHVSMWNDAEKFNDTLARFLTELSAGH